MKICVEAVEFVGRHGEPHIGTAVFATVENGALVGIGVRYDAGEGETTLFVPAHAFSRSNFLRLCGAAGIVTAPHRLG